MSEAFSDCRIIHCGHQAYRLTQPQAHMIAGYKSGRNEFQPEELAAAALKPSNRISEIFRVHGGKPAKAWKSIVRNNGGTKQMFYFLLPVAA